MVAVAIFRLFCTVGYNVLMIVRVLILLVQCQVIGQRWQELTPEQVEYYKKKAEEDMKRYKDQMEGEFVFQQHHRRRRGTFDSHTCLRLLKH